MIIAISNQKGGVGKTTTSVSLGAAIVQRGHEVLGVDLDPQANLTLALGVKPASLRRTVADVLMGTLSPVSASRETGLPGFDLLPANHDLQLVEQFLHTRANHATTLQHLLKQATAYEYIICDCPPALGHITLNALTAADVLLIPTQCEYYSAYALNEMLDTVRYVREHTNPRLSYRILITLFDRRNRVHHTVYEQIKTAFGHSVCATIIEIDTKLRESQVFGQPITAYAPQSRAAQQYRSLAEELTRDAQAQKTAQSA